MKNRYYAIWFETPKGDSMFWAKHDEYRCDTKKDLNKWLKKHPGAKWLDKKKKFTKKEQI